MSSRVSGTCVICSEAIEGAHTFFQCPKPRDTKKMGPHMVFGEPCVRSYAILHAADNPQCLHPGCGQSLAYLVPKRSFCQKTLDGCWRHSLEISILSLAHLFPFFTAYTLGDHQEAPAVFNDVMMYSCCVTYSLMALSLDARIVRLAPEGEVSTTVIPILFLSAVGAVAAITGAASLAGRIQTSAFRMLPVFGGSIYGPILGAAIGHFVTRNLSEVTAQRVYNAFPRGTVTAAMVGGAILSTGRDAELAALVSALFLSTIYIVDLLRRN